jgi:hypothetical protein
MTHELKAQSTMNTSPSLQAAAHPAPSRKPATDRRTPTRSRGTDSPPKAVLALKAQGCADALDISLSTFNALVKEGKMPKPIAIPGHPGLALYDFAAVCRAWAVIVEGQDDGALDNWDDVR